ncbi:hypothetical protein [Chryseobacterium limigenitum]|uniref:Uncharacterized protein n=1 Tax=Chryseobacterium limigenitum TaxID=1612149 RepID=A0A1K2IV94_9FLAO|nr:hypothetical protein [Chryseobacterium limigenitum]SFZ96194.1 hypothetical protein SAMN05216324_1176 [Chryseobacterium limigenitum]
MGKFQWTIVFSFVTPILLLLVVFMMGGGHGTYIPTIILFPFGMIGTVFQKSITVPFVVLGLFQFPIYGYLLDIFKNNKYKYLILISHILFVIIVFIFTNFK